MSRLLFHECLGRGGYGEVYRCTWYRREMELQVAVKVLNASVAKGSEAQKRLKDEARLLGALTHPGILRVYDLVELRGNVAMLAEYISGADLDRCVLDGLPPRALLETVSRVSSALAAAWGDISPVSGKPLRLVHRDVKPENVRITPHGEVKLLDFGVARAAELRREAQTGSHTVMGSYRYMAPERFDTGLVPHPSVDVFALGCILYEGIAFRRLFEHLSMREMLVLSLPGTTRYENYIAERLAELPDITEQSTIQLIRRLVSRDPAHRPLPGRLAALCDDEADRLSGQGLAQWCRAREWERGSMAPGEWSGRSFELGEGTSGGYDIGSVYGDEVPPTDGPATTDATMSAVNFIKGDFTGEVGLGPPDLDFGDAEIAPDGETEPDPHAAAGVFADEPTVGQQRPPPPPTPPVSSSTRDPAPPRTSGPPRKSEPLPVPAPAPPLNSKGPPLHDADETLVRPRSVLDAPPPGPNSVPPAPQRQSLPDAPTQPSPESVEPLRPDEPDPESTTAEGLPPHATRPESDYDAPEKSSFEAEPTEIPPDPHEPPAPRPSDSDLPQLPPSDASIAPEPDPVVRRPPRDEITELPTEPRTPAPARDVSEPVDPDRQATEAVDLQKLREKIEAEKKRFHEQRRQSLPEETSTADVPPVQSLAQSVPDDLFDVPIDAKLPNFDDIDDPDEQDTERDAVTLQDHRPPPKKPRAPPKKRKGGAPLGGIVANLAVIGVLLALGFLVLILWIVAF